MATYSRVASASAGPWPARIRARDALDRLGGHPHAGQFRQILAPGIERCLGSHPGHQPAHPGAEGSADHVEVPILGNDPGAALVAALHTVVVGAAHRHLAQDGLEVLGPVADELGLVAVAAVDALAAMPAVVRIEQLLEHRRTHPVHRPANHQLGGSESDRAARAVRLEGAVD